MTHDLERHHRRSTRLRGYDYTQAGVYSVTLCTQGRQCLFGEIHDDRMHLNEAGRMIGQVWAQLPVRFPFITKAHGWQPFPGRLWQRNYYGHIIRNDAELNRIRDYIRDNPIRWETGENHPDNVKLMGQIRGRNSRIAPTERAKMWR